MADAVQPTLRELAARGIEYRGVLYAGLMLTADGPKMLEYNVRFGDPECQVVRPAAHHRPRRAVPRRGGGRAVARHHVHRRRVRHRRARERGLPGRPRTGDPIDGLDDAARVEGAMVFHAGTRRVDGAICTAGGRVLAVTAMGPSLDDARARAYDAASRITWPGRQYRRDIAAAVAGT